MMDARYFGSATVVVEDFDAALVFVAQAMQRLHLEAPQVAITPNVTAEGLAGLDGTFFQVIVGGRRTAPGEVRA